MQVGTMPDLEPKPPRNRQQQHYCPSDRNSHRNCNEKRQPLPERHPEKDVFDQERREFAFDLVGRKVVIQLRDFAESVGRKQPDFTGIGVRNPDEDHGNIRVAAGKSPDGLLIGSSVGIPFRTGAELSQAAHEGAVHEHLQLLGQFRALRLTPRSAHLQVVGGGLVISSLRRLQESNHGSRRRPASQFIGGR